MIEGKIIKLDKVICINAKNKPNEISNKHWVEEGKEYTPIKLLFNPIQKLQFFVLEEVKPDNPLYGGYRVDRFGVPKSVIEELIEEGVYETVQ